MGAWHLNLNLTPGLCIHDPIPLRTDSSLFADKYPVKILGTSQICATLIELTKPRHDRNRHRTSLALRLGGDRAGS